jgi:hypothetical protein
VGKGILMNTLTPPIFVIDGHDVGVFASIEDVQIQLEAIDVRNNEYMAFDAEGRPLELVARGKRVRVAPRQGHPSHRRELETALRDFLMQMKEPVAQDQACDLPCLVEACQKFVHKPSSATDILTRGWWRK